MHRHSTESADAPWERPLRPANFMSLSSRRGEDHTIPKCPVPITSPTRRVMRNNLNDTLASDCWSSGSTESDASARQKKDKQVSPPCKPSTQSTNFCRTSKPASQAPKEGHAISQLMQRNMPRLYPNLDEMNTNHSAKRAATLSKMDAHRRQRIQCRSQKLCQGSEQEAQDVPVVTAPQDRVVERNDSSSEAKSCLQDQERQDMIHHHQVEVKTDDGVDGASQKSEDNKEDESEEMSKTPSFFHDMGPSSHHDEMSNTPSFFHDMDPSSHHYRQQQSHSTRNQASNPMGGDKAIPKALDKTYLKQLASQHRFSVSANIISGTGRATVDGPVPAPRQLPTPGANNGGTLVTPPVSPFVCQGSPRTATRHQYVPSTTATANKNQTKKERMMVEVWPGLSAPLRGSDETVTAVAHRFYTSFICFGCTTRVYCIADVQFAICPVCRVISPLEHEDTYCGQPIPERWGLGLGFTSDSLWNMQVDIAAFGGM
ncbi:expressed unknown protein [Seminavis robusta]|uniref:Uncharacterized protein n=1 Tax=Seminavis robusta TaxID=568900 RepID=A0A9N8EWR0_9STRA|nr:expressed unknown protein [Seminavis robusta]|eukprot:Sro1831_g300370.1 n/a (486) ;mRNA; f:12457-14017